MAADVGGVMVGGSGALVMRTASRGGTADAAVDIGDGKPGFGELGFGETGFADANVLGAWDGRSVGLTVD
jgi:hypothetical protein